MFDEFQYKSPINIISSPVHIDMVEEQEKTILKAIQNVKVDVDRDELIKALQYDRNQYEKGKVDGIRQFISRLQQHERDNWIDFQQYGITWSDIEKIAKEMGVDLSETD
jgi:hypothetical protein